MEFAKLSWVCSPHSVMLLTLVVDIETAFSIFSISYRNMILYKEISSQYKRSSKIFTYNEIIVKLSFSLFKRTIY